MSRKSRKSCCSRIFHIMVQGINKEYIFEKRIEKLKYMSLLKEMKTDNVQIISYTIMGNHAHMLLYVKDIQNMSEFMKNINERYAMYYNYINKRVGVVFRNRFKTQEILSRKHLYNCIKYIYNNPVKANIVKKIIDYPYSNYENFKDEKIIDTILQKNEIFELNNKKISNKESFIDTKEDINYFVEDILNSYSKYKSLKNKEDLKIILLKIKNELDVSYVNLSEILEIPKSTIWDIMADKSKKEKS